MSNRQALQVLKANNQYKNRLLESFTHELRTPINGALPPLEACMSDSACPEFIKETYLNHVSQSLNLLRYSLNDIMDFGLMLSGDITLNSELFNLKSLIGETV